MSPRPFDLRIWDCNTKHWTSLETFIAGSYVGLTRDGFIVQQGMNRKDKNGKQIYEGDYVEVETECGYKNLFEVKFGTVRRVTDQGAWIEINGFYFEDPYNLGEGGKFSIVQNWKGCNDLFVTEIIGNIFEKPERAKYLK